MWQNGEKMTDWSKLNRPSTKLVGNKLAGRDLLRLLDLTPSEFKLVLSTALAQKKAWAAGKFDAPYPGKAVGIIMEKPSLRTRISFEIGVSRLGAHPAVMSDKNSAFSRGETIKDTVMVLERFVDAIVLRTYQQSKVEEVAKWAQVPVINALTDDFHPCQGLADFLTIFEHKGNLSELRLAYIGDGNNMAHTYLEGGALCGMQVAVATPVRYGPDPKIVEECQKVAEQTGAKLEVGHSMANALAAADVVITDTWASMGSESEHYQRLKDFADYTVDEAAMTRAKPGAIFMHCLPAHRGEEVTDEVMDAPYSAIYDEAANRLHAQKALLSLVLAKAK
jgi:ornithine carbamoyltransferase